jgi:hypothetical protein
MLGSITQVILLVIKMACLVVATANAAPPASQPVDPEIHKWYQSLKRPNTGDACCSIADCRPYDTRVIGDHYEILDHQRWRAVPNDVVLHRENKAGAAIACLQTQWYDFGPPPRDFAPAILCFIPGPEA